jgi:membrane-bound serine protease (ClpP class)
MGLLGVISMALGGIMLVKKTDLGVSVDMGVAIGAAVGFGVLFLFLSYLVMRVFRQKKQTGAESLVGMRAKTITELNPEGRIMLHGEYWKAVAPGHVPEGVMVVVVRIEGLTAYVEPIQEA